MNENGGPNLMEKVVMNEWKRKTSAKCTIKIIQNVVQNYCKT